MRTLIALIIVFTTINSCSGQSGAVKDQQAAFKELEAMKAKGLVPTSEGGASMTCQIDGKPWKASSVYPINFSERINGNFKETYISFPVPDLRAGGKHKFSDHFVVDFNPENDLDFWGGRICEIEITKVADGWVEGKFFFTATVLETNKKMEITDGYFRVPLKKPV